ncbi:MAG: hypothetical protein E7312_01770 [Clostridiales bacterium]|nr:hypothetical protein [Clostridiales bacterium]
MLGALMFSAKIITEALPNIHLLGMLIMAYTVALRKKALVPIYVYVMLNGIYAGFAMWWLPYLYIWTLLWGMTMLLPRNIPQKAAYFVYPVVCALHGFLFGVLYAPGQALMYGFNFEQTLAWIASGIPFDIIHGISNFVMGFLVFPLAKTLTRLMRQGA